MAQDLTSSRREQCVKSLIAFSQVLLQELGKRCGVSTARDSITLSRRVEDEGLSFLTITLSDFGKSLERAIDQGQVGSDQFAGFRRSGGLPRFLGGFLCLVFDKRTGHLLDEPSVDAILALRQFCLAFSKIEIPCSDARVSRAFDKFVECEQDLISLRVHDAEERREFKRVSTLLFGEVFSKVQIKLDQGTLRPKHGPGATADRLVANEKWMQSEWTDRLEPFFPAGEFLFPSWSWWQELQSVEFLEPGAERPVRVISVPKTLKTPRIIAIEPTCMQYAQQALARELVAGIERDDILSSMIGFRDQLPNREMARIGSLTGSLATLDLSEASDRVLNLHVLDLFSWTPSLSGAVQACRSTKADVPGKGIVPLVKFASMGSALCFPVEAMVFLTVVFLGIQRSSGSRLTRASMRGMSGQVRVYGDDIIVPVEYTSSVIDSLEAYGLKVNRTKSFWTGKFRESCGGDFFDGTWVTPVRVKKLFPESLRHVDSIVSTVSLRNQLFEAGYEETVEYLDRLLERVLPVYPEVPRDSAALGRHSFAPVRAQRMCPDLHRPLIKACVVDAPLPASPLAEHGALMKFFLERGDEPLGVQSFSRAGRPAFARIKMRWLPVARYGDGAQRSLGG